MGFDITSGDSLFNGYLSYNFSKFSDYWYIRKHLQGHKASTIVKYLKIGIQRILDAEINPGFNKGEDGWSASLNVFSYHLNHFLEEITELIKKYPSHANTRYYIDQTSNPGETDYSDVVSEPDVDTEDELSQDSDVELPEEPQVYTYFRHPMHGTMKVDTFAKASEVYTIMVLKGDLDRADAWLQLAKQMPDAPN